MTKRLNSKNTVKSYIFVWFFLLLSTFNVATASQGLNVKVYEHGFIEEREQLRPWISVLKQKFRSQRHFKRLYRLLLEKLKAGDMVFFHFFLETNGQIHFNKGQAVFKESIRMVRINEQPAICSTSSIKGVDRLMRSLLLASLPVDDLPNDLLTATRRGAIIKFVRGPGKALSFSFDVDDRIYASLEKI